MISYFMICSVSLAAAWLTMYSGFGLGTLLLPVFALFFPVEVAVAATAVVHSANNLFKIGLVGRYADRQLVLHFGVPAMLAAFAGAAALGYVAHLGEVVAWSLGSRQAVITPLKLVMGLLMLIFALFELLPRLRELKIDRRWLVPGGLLSGFFGGFSGHQGALRSAFLAKVGIAPPSLCRHQRGDRLPGGRGPDRHLCHGFSAGRLWQSHRIGAMALDPGRDGRCLCRSPARQESAAQGHHGRHPDPDRRSPAVDRPGPGLRSDLISVKNFSQLSPFLLKKIIWFPWRSRRTLEHWRESLIVVVLRRSRTDGNRKDQS